MRIQTSDIFTLPAGPEDAVCVTTNGMVRKDCRAVMGRGIALEADKRFDLAHDLGALLRREGNKVHDMGVRTDATTGRTMRVFTFPTKTDWRLDSDLDLIQKSARELVELVAAYRVRTCYLPKPGCSNGRLDWETQVRPVLEPILDDRFVIADLK